MLVGKLHAFRSAVGVALILTAFGISASVASAASAAGATSTLWFAQPAPTWSEALPIGSGRLGAMVFGGITDDRIQFNEDTLWTGKPHDYVRAGAGEQLAELRRLLFEGKPEDAQKLGKAKFLSDPVRQKAFQPFGDLRLHFPGHEVAKATDYRRELDLDAAVARVSYRVGDVAYRREIFASHPDNVIVVRLTADRAHSVSVSLRLDSPHKSATTQSLGEDTLVLTGRVQDDGLRFESRVIARIEGGRIARDDRGLVVEEADAVTLVLVAATSFKNFEDISADPAARCTAAAAAVATKSFASLLDAHLIDHRALFRRVALDLGTTERASLPIDRRIAAVKQSGVDGDPALAALDFQFGRYLLVASSRPGDEPANLQGIWNELLDPPWESKFTTNINFEMNYWPAEVANLSECADPMFALIDDVVVSGRRTARAQYGCRGWVLHHNTDLWRGTAPINNIDGIWPTGGAWLCQHLWEHFLFTGDREFLARRAYPVMKEASEFFIDFLVKDPKTGWLVSTPSFSPEQGTLTIGPTMDQQLIRALMDHTIAAANILGVDREFVASLAKVRAQVAPNLIGKHGQLQEWLDDVDVPNNNHRHMSPLWALFPGAEITPADPTMFAAAKKLLEWRGDGNTGWSFAWRMPLWARVGDGDFAHRQLSLLLAKRTLPNLFDLCGPFQIDGNFGAAAGIAEMLVQSHVTVGDVASLTPLIDVLPALPHAWPTGSVAGLRARGGFEVDLAWTNGVLTRVVLRSTVGGACRLRYGGHALDLRTTKGGEYVFDGNLHTKS